MEKNRKGGRKVAIHVYMQDKEVRYLRRTATPSTYDTYRSNDETTQPAI